MIPQWLPRLTSVLGFHCKYSMKMKRYIYKPSYQSQYLHQKPVAEVNCESKSDQIRVTYA